MFVGRRGWFLSYKIVYTKQAAKDAEKIKASNLYEKAKSYIKMIKNNPYQTPPFYILSAKYGLLEENDVIEDYNETLNTKSAPEIKEWSVKVLTSL